ncbi:MAG: MBL fold metallo-hydrolase, partial [Dehalococcoidia bacterium]|nr:MBL fold metallo-hydrolase [Dehalococcoidia bacterium]
STMEITWLGYSSFRIKGKDTVLITDPFPSVKEEKSGQLTANIVTISHPHFHHSYLEGIAGNPMVIKGPGEYEVAEVFIWGYPSFHDSESGAKLGKNTVYLMHWEDLTLCHLGDIGHIPGSELAAKLSNIDILMVPAGSGSTLNASLAAQVVRLLEPKIIIPMHYRTDGTAASENLPQETDTVNKFLAEVGGKDAIPQPRFNISRSSIPEKTRVVLLSPR